MKPTVHLSWLLILASAHAHVDDWSFGPDATDRGRQESKGEAMNRPSLIDLFTRKQEPLPDIKVFTGISAAAAAFPGKIVRIEPDAPIYDGIDRGSVTSMSISGGVVRYDGSGAGAREKAMSMAYKKAAASGAPGFVVHTDSFHRQERMPGRMDVIANYHLYYLVPVTLLDLNADNLVATMRRAMRGEAWARDSSGYVGYIVQLARRPEFASLTKTYREWIREHNSADLRNPTAAMLPELVGLIAHHDKEGAVTDLERYVRYHLHKPTKIAAYQALLGLNKIEMVDALLRQEEDAEVRSAMRVAVKARML